MASPDTHTPMKIIAIDQKQSCPESTPDRVAYRTDKQISEAVAKHFLQLYSERPDSGGIPVEVRGSLVYITSMNPPRNFADFVAQLLTQAERFVAHDQDFEREAKQVATSQKDETLKRISEEQNLPIV